MQFFYFGHFWGILAVSVIFTISNTHQYFGKTSKNGEILGPFFVTPAFCPYHTFFFVFDVFGLIFGLEIIFRKHILTVSGFLLQKITWVAKNGDFQVSPKYVM